MATLKPTTPLRPLLQATMKPPSPMRPKNAPKTPISHPQRRRRFQLGLSLREQRRRRFHERDFQCPRAMVGPGCGGRGRWRGLAGLRDDAPSHTSATRRRRCGGRRRVRRARAGFEIDHSEPQARVWRSRGRPGPTAPGTPAEPQATTRSADGERAGRRPRAHTAARPSRARKATRPDESGPRGGRRSGEATSNASTLARHSKRGRHQPTPCASALTHP